MARQPAAHSRIHDHFAEQIRQGLFEDGGQLPTEAEIAREFGVSRATVQIAMSRLAWGGWIRRYPGRGTFANVQPGARGPAMRDLRSRTNVEDVRGDPFDVPDELPGGFASIPSFALDADGISAERAEKLVEYYRNARSATISYRLTSFARTRISDRIATELMVDRDVTIFEMERRKYLEDTAVEIEHHYFAPDVSPKFDTADLDSLSTEELFVKDRLGVDIDRMEVTMQKLKIKRSEFAPNSLLSLKPNFLVKWFSEDGRIIVFTMRFCWGTPPIFI